MKQCKDCQATETKKWYKQGAQCNKGIGMLKDSENLLQAAISYLRSARECL